MKRINMEKDEKETFESVYKRLDTIVNKMEKESPDLETALKAFEEGKKAADQCRKMLEEAELKLKDLRYSDEAGQE